jgi:hypothetical protein
MIQMKIFAKIGLLIALYYLVYWIYVGVQNPIPALGDSWDYHIPIAQTLLDGRFLHPQNFILKQRYYPGSSEIFIAVLMVLKIPLTLSNLLASVVLGVCLWKLGCKFGLKYYWSILFAVTFCTLNAIVRWGNAVSIDIWVGVFFSLALLLLESPKKEWKYFFQLGVVMGMLVGSKYTALLLLPPLALFYFQKIWPTLTLKNVVTFLIPFSLLGVFWYVRNFIFTHNPVYPLIVLGLPGEEVFSGYRVWGVTLQYPAQMLNAFISEYKMWFLTVFLAIAALIKKFVIKKDFNVDSLSRLFLIGIINFVFFFTFPTSDRPEIMVSSLRYSFPAFIPLMLGAFLLAQKYRKEELIGFIAIGNMIMVTSFAYYPKLVFLYIPLALATFYFLDIQKKEKKEK